MKPKIIFLVLSVPSSSDMRRFGIDYFNSQGFFFEIICLRKLFYSEAIKDKIDVNYPILFPESVKELSQILSKQPNHLVLFDYFMGLSAWIGKSYQIYYLLKHFKIPYIIVSMAPLPLSKKGDAKEQVLNKVVKSKYQACIRKGKQIIDVGFFNFLLSRLLRKIPKLFPKPAAIFSNKTEVLYKYCLQNKYSLEHVYPINSFDYERYLDYMENKKNHLVDGNYIVFADEALTHHPDDNIQKVNNINEDYYYSMMNYIFRDIESKTGCAIIIAAHPYSSYKKNPFDGRKIIIDSTVHLIANCKGVIGHMSTSLGFAALFDKPLLIVNFPDISSYVYILASHLGITPVTIHKNTDFKKIDFYKLLKKGGGYKDYIQVYLKSDDANEKRSWEIIEKQLTGIA